MKKGIVIFLLLISMVFISGCLEVEYSPSIKIKLGATEKPTPQIAEYNYSHFLPKEVVNDVNDIEVEEIIEDNRPVFAKFNN